MTSLYVHVPYCEQKCFYCAFNSKAGSGYDDRARFVDAVTAELHRRRDRRPLDTIYIGGGTPSVLEPNLLDRLLHAVSDRAGLADGYEWTVEVNPGTAVEAVMPILAARGVNRVSMGVQSMDPRRLKEMGRLHGPSDVVEAVRLVRSHGIRRFNLDLIYGQPDQSLADWNEDLETVLALNPEHLSLYCLQYEEGTVWTERRRKGVYDSQDEDLAADMFHRAVAATAVKGLRWYEVSNFSVPGHESRHNGVYWRNEDYEAVGPGAYGREGSVRWKEIEDIKAWTSAALDGSTVRMEEEVLGPVEDYLDLLTSGLRTREGVDLDIVRRKTGLDVSDSLQSHLKSSMESGLLEREGSILRLTDSGILVLDDIVLPFYEALDRR